MSLRSRRSRSARVDIVDGFTDVPPRTCLRHQKRRRTLDVSDGCFEVSGVLAKRKSGKVQLSNSAAEQTLTGELRRRLIVKEEEGSELLRARGVRACDKDYWLSLRLLSAW